MIKKVDRRERKIEEIRKLNLEQYYENAKVDDNNLMNLGLNMYIKKSKMVKNDIYSVFHQSKYDNKIVLHPQQAECIDLLFKNNNMILSAPTSFGKTYVAFEFIARNDFNNIVFIVPTIALMNEIMKKVKDRFSDNYNIITNSFEDFEQKNIFILVPERVDVELINKIKEVDFLVFDEIYKLKRMQTDKEKERDKRIIALNRGYFELVNRSKRVLLQGPFIKDVVFERTKLNNNIVKYFTDYSPVYNKIDFIEEDKNIFTIKENILKHHTLEGVITLSKDTFYRVGTMPCIAIFTAGEPHPTDKICKFINFEDDGYEVSKHIGLLETEAAKDKKQHLLDVWFDRIEEETNYCVKTTITDHDEWLHSYYYFNEEIPTSLEFEESVNDALTFEFKMIMENKEYLYDFKDKISNIEKVERLEEKNWKTFKIKEIFETFKGINGLQTHTGAYVPKKKLMEGNMPRITVRDTNNGVDGFYNSNDKNYRVFENFISVSFLGSVFYHQYKASLDMKVHALILKDHDLNKYIAEFLKVMIKMNTQHSSYGNQLSSTDLPNMRILLPVNENELPDWNYMERFSKMIIDDKMKKYTGYFNKV